MSSATARRIGRDQGGASDTEDKAEIVEGVKASDLLVTNPKNLNRRGRAGRGQEDAVTASPLTASLARPQAARLLLDQLLQQRAMAVRRIGAGRRTQQRDRLAGGDLARPGWRCSPAASAPSSHRDSGGVYSSQANGQLPMFAVEGGVQFLARTELTPPQVPGLFLLRQGARPITADQQAKAIVRLRADRPSASS